MIKKIPSTEKEKSDSRHGEIQGMLLEIENNKSDNEVKSIMQKYGHYDLAQTDYQRFKADSNRFNKADSTVEYLHILEK